MTRPHSIITIYRTEPVAEQVWNFGLRLREAIEGMCQEYGIAARCKGTPYRMILSFQESDAYRLLQKKTLYMQELLALGLSAYNGILSPSHARREKVFQKTVSKIDQALALWAEADRQNDFNSLLEIPPLTEFF